MADHPVDIPMIYESNLAGLASKHMSAERTDNGGGITPTVDKDNGLVAFSQTLPQFIQEFR